ncbi:DUF4760 domain-containing protein [Alloacidobacterium dinghuense]|uniref:DUF4760 domain-containing protein n=1 Tax=Alloacidobacterium dinghuense TaxID=2763107 RepID=A0A7G8BE76_9BACT|nr:DUF4760 domain-containing protein [Alloacidobacterium dinghuense]QNI30846.1 DUF4760 domain-containing protein [Alloacidobacterium dinghuense]
MSVSYTGVLDVIKDFGPIVTAVGVFVAVWTLRANHDWNRRQYTAILVAGWNEKTSIHRKAIERLRPGLIDLDSKGTPTELTRADAAAIYTAKPDTPEWELRFHFVEFLNHLEAIASAYRNKVADEQMLEESFRSVLIRVHDILVNFIATVDQHRGYEAWEPYSAVVAYWKRKPFKPRRYTA